MLPASFSNPRVRKPVFAPASASGVWAMCVSGLGDTGGEKVKILLPVWWYFQFCFPDLPPTISFLANLSTHSVQGWYLHSVERQTGLGLPHLAQNWFPSVLFVYIEVCEWSESRSIVSDSLWPYGLYSWWSSPGQNIGVGSLSLLQGIFPTQESNQGLLHCRRILYQLSYQGSPYWGIVDLRYCVTVSGVQHSDLVFLCYALFKGITK